MSDVPRFETCGEGGTLPTTIRCGLPKGHHGRHRCGCCHHTWENEADLRPCTSREVGVLGFDRPTPVRCGLKAEHDGPHFWGMSWVGSADTGGPGSFPEPPDGMTWADVAAEHARWNCPACAGLTAHHNHEAPESQDTGSTGETGA